MSAQMPIPKRDQPPEAYLYPDERDEIIARLVAERDRLIVDLDFRTKQRDEANRRTDDVEVKVQTARAALNGTVGLRCTVSGPDTLIFLRKLGEAEKALRV